MQWLNLNNMPAPTFWIFDALVSGVLLTQYKPIFLEMEHGFWEYDVYQQTPEFTAHIPNCLLCLALLFQEAS